VIELGKRQFLKGQLHRVMERVQALSGGFLARHLAQRQPTAGRG